METEEIWETMYVLMNIQSQSIGFMIDATAGIDIALWDLKGKLLSESVAPLLGGQRRVRLSAYIAGADLGHFDRAPPASRSVVHGTHDLPLSFDLDRALCPSTVKVDTHWRFHSAYEAIQVSRQLEELGFGFVEAPLPPEDIDGNARVAATLDIPVPLASRCARLTTS